MERGNIQRVAFAVVAVALAAGAFHALSTSGTPGAGTADPGDHASLFDAGSVGEGDRDAEGDEGVAGNGAHEPGDDSATLLPSGAPLCPTMREAWPVRKYSALGWKRAAWVRGIQIPGHPGYPMLAYYVGLLRYLQRHGWTETMSIGDASLMFAMFKIADRVPWYTMQANGQPMFVTSFPTRSVFSRDRGCVIYEKQSMYACLLEHAKKQHDEESVFSFFPRTFIYDPADPGALGEFSRLYDHVSLDESFSTNKWLVKPGRDTFGGTGISIADGKEATMTYLRDQGPQMPRGAYLVVQKLLDHVFTIDNRRFDVRVYVLVTSLKPVIAFWSPYAMVVRLAGKVAHTERHRYLTNFSLHHDKGGLWSASDLIEYLRERDARERKAPTDVDQDPEALHEAGMLEHSFNHVTLPSITRALGTVFSLPQRFVHRKNSFQLFGCDFMLDARDLRAWFIECNGRPLWFGAAHPEKFSALHDRMAEQIFRKAAKPGCETEDDVFTRIPVPPDPSTKLEPLQTHQKQHARHQQRTQQEAARP